MQAFNHYRDAAAPLQERIGAYCCYCERYLETHVAVEHVSPKSHDKAQIKLWSNLLLSCVNCNSNKGQTVVQIDDYLWPDRDNTLLAVNYRGALVSAAQGLEPDRLAKIEALICLVGLDRDPGNPLEERQPTKDDRRWKTRQDRWDAAQRALVRLEKNDSAELREQIVETAAQRGCFGIWFTVFRDHTEILERLIAEFPGTSSDCFENCSPVERPNPNL